MVVLFFKMKRPPELYRHSGADLIKGGHRMHPWTTEVDSVTALLLMGIASQSPIGNDHYDKLKKLHTLNVPPVFYRPVNNISAGDILNGKTGRIEKRYFSGGCPPFLFSGHNVSQLRMNIPSVDLPVLQGHVDLAGVGGLRPVVNHHFGLL
jgi:hypothetical protein